MARDFKVESVHKEMYPAGDNFKDDADGVFPSDSNWTDQDGAGCETTVIASLDGHRKVLQFYDNSANRAQARSLFTQGLNTEIEFWFTKSSVAADTNLEVLIYEGGTNIVWLVFTENDLQYYDGVWNDIKLNFLVADTFSHFKLVLDDTANTFDCYIDGVLEKADAAYRNNSTSGADGIIWKTDTTDTGYYCYLDALGISTDTDYNVGDNVHWRHLKESTDDFESDDVGTQGTSITWVDGLDTAASFELVQEFNEHKKILRGYYSSAAGGFDSAYHSFASQAKTGWASFWFKTSDITIQNVVYLSEDAIPIVGFGIDASQFQVFTAGAWRQATASPIPVNDTWYHIYIQWYDAATDTFDLWIDNVQYEDGTNCIANQTSGINRAYITCYSATEYGYIDAPMSSLDSDNRADNRTFDYLDYTKTDITDDVINVLYVNRLFQWRTATLLSEEDYENSEVFFQVYDINSILAFEGEIKNRTQVGAVRRYPLRDKNWDDLNDRLTHTFTADDIHDPTDTASMLKVALPNVSHLEGDLLLANADIKTTTYSPTIKNYPIFWFLKDLSDIADSVTIVKANGVIILDDDLASGDSLDVDVEADKDLMSAAPIPVDILESINYFEIFGAMNLDTGERFFKIIDNSGTDKKRKWRYVNNSFRSQTDVDNYATALSTRVISIKVIRNVVVQSLGTHNMGETFDYKYVDANINIPQNNYYIIEERINFAKNVAVIKLSEGLLEQSKYASNYERNEEYNNTLTAEIYETDIITLLPEMRHTNADEVSGAIRLDAVGESLWVKPYVDTEIDPTRDMTITFVFRRGDANADTVDITKTLFYYLADGLDAGTIYWGAVADTIPAANNLTHIPKTFTIPAAILANNTVYDFRIVMNEAARVELAISCIVKYYQKRSV